MSAGENKRNEQVDVNKCCENNLSGLGAMHIINNFFLKKRKLKREEKIEH
jgi:flagella basal body P-ring formation protein FlgA